MSVDIEPSELGFQRPFNVEVSQALKIKNPNTTPISFKVKTTAPKQYCVRPNSGRIEPGHDLEVTVLLQAMKQEPPPNARCRDKFLVQSVPITGDKEFTNIQEIWDAVDKASIQEKKIRVNWLAPTEGGHEAAVTPLRHNLANGVEATPDAPPPAYSSPSEDKSIIDHTTGSEPTSGFKENIKEAAGTVASTVSSNVSTARSAAGATVEELKEQLAKAQATIASLKEDAQAGLRQRKLPSTGAEVQEKAEQLATQVRQGTEGVPLHIVAVLCLAVFLLAYAFF